MGLSAALLWRNNGRIAGISGIVGGLLTPRATDVVRRAAFILGLIAAPVFYGFARGALPKIEVTSPLLVIVSGGFLVGFGTRLGSGCTSGHGVCGLANYSPRSLLATLGFMIAAAATVYLVRH